MNKLKHLILFLSLIILIKLSAQGFYDINTIQKIEITFKESNWDNMLDTAKAGSEGYIMAQSVLINGIKFDSVGVKYKGNSTYKATQVKNPFHIELDTYKEQDYEGYTDIKLSNVAKDPSFVREVLSYAILRQYMAAPLSNFANVYVNGKLIGLYANCESVGKKFVKKHFYSKNNSFFKCNPIGGAGPTSGAKPNLVYLGTDSTLYYPSYELNSKFGWKDLINLSNTLSNNINSIENILDVDKALWMLAFDNVTVNLDSYIGIFAQNYYLYQSDNGLFNCVLWDFNEGLGVFSQTGTLNYSGTSAKSQMTHLLHSADAAWPLVQKLLSIPKYKRMYIAHIQTILSENFANNYYKSLAQNYQLIIDAAVQADANKFFTYANFKSNLSTDVQSAPGITTLMSARNTYLSALADFTASKPVISDIAPSDTNPAFKSTVFIKTKISNSSGIWLGYRASAEDKFTKVQMLDDGTHGDGSAGDLTFGASVFVSAPVMQYFIYAENNNAGIFSPARAEHEFYTLNAKMPFSNIVLNEIYARGTITNPDWVEIYNSSDNDLDISSFKIYDEGGYEGTKPKKQFPAGTILSGKSYLVIITDDDSTDGFGLSASGEKIWLENATGTVVDSVTYETHTIDQSYGRMPDGGEWHLFDTITKGTANGSNTGVPEIISEPGNSELNCLPNPFKSIAKIQFDLTKPQNISLKIYNLTGEIIETLADGMVDGGTHSYKWNAEKFENGIYLVRLQKEDKIISRKLILCK